MNTSVSNYKNIYYPPGGILMWIIIYLELFTFGMALIAMVYYGKEEAESFHNSRLLLNTTYGMINTILLLSSGFFMAVTVNELKKNKQQKAQKYLLVTMLFGLLFLGMVPAVFLADGFMDGRDEVEPDEGQDSPSDDLPPGNGTGDNGTGDFLSPPDTFITAFLIVSSELLTNGRSLIENSPLWLITSSISFASLVLFSPAASGKSISRWLSLVKVVDTIKNINSKKTTSISGVKLTDISSST